VQSGHGYSTLCLPQKPIQVIPAKAGIQIMRFRETRDRTPAPASVTFSLSVAASSLSCL
jgi:hypothetical protein